MGKYNISNLIFRPGDSQWIENFNTVLDENRMLCLANGKRIKLPNTFYFIFEMSELSEITPSTISRCGLIYIDQENLPW